MLSVPFSWVQRYKNLFYPVSCCTIFWLAPLGLATENLNCAMFKGLQRPLEFMGLQGRYITWAAITAAVGILGFMIVYAIAGFIVGLVFAVAALSTGMAFIMVKQRKGLHTKKTDKGIFVYANISKL